MIRPAREADRQAAAQIWRACFTGDDDAYIASFLDACFGQARCLLDFEGTEPAAMVHLLPMELRAGGRALPAQCLYAAATLPQCRGRGIMRRLIEASVQSGLEAGRACTVLMPASQSLYRFYAASGFRDVNALRCASLSRAELEAAAGGEPAAALLPPDYARMEALRRRHFENAALWEGAMPRFVFEEWTRTGGSALMSDEGYALVIMQEDGLFVKELCAAGAPLRALL
ncbi:MAG: GNAT family N-acetyltransferase, partial [Clostridia bacterium]|nr:GNAT family N-acetyltransferase [Clostridia bacterium]